MTTTEPTTSTAVVTEVETTDAERFARLAPADIHPDPENRAAPIDKAFAASIATHGVLEPILVVAHPDIPGAYLLVAGERRWRAATAANLDTIPAVVSELSDTDRVVRQITENLHRLDLDPIAEAHQFMRLATLGMKTRALAKAVGRSEKIVRERLRLIELPDTAQALITSGTWSLDDAAHALTLIDHPDHLNALIAEGRGGIEHRVRRISADIEREHAITVLVDEAIDAGKTMITLETPHRPLTDLGISAEDHAAEECHAHIVAAPNFGAPKLVEVCTDPSRHTKRGPSTVKKPANTSTLTEEQREAKRATTEANAARTAAITAVVTGRIAKADAWATILPAYLDAINADTAKRTGKILGIEGTKDTYWPTAIKTYAAESDAATMRAAYAAALVSANTDLERGWSDTVGNVARLVKILKAAGWKPAAYCKAQIARLK